jgi:hypothetical protein
VNDGDRRVLLDRLDRVPDKLASLVSLRDDAVCTVFVISLDRYSCPSVWRMPSGKVGDDIAASIESASSDNNSCERAVCSGRNGWIDRNDNSNIT